MNLLICKQENGDYALNQEMLEFVRAISSKYRIYLLTNLSDKPENLDK